VVAVRVLHADVDRECDEDELGAMVTDAKTFFESERAAEPLDRLANVLDHAVIVTAGSCERGATYAQRIKNRTAKVRKSPPRPAAKARPAAAPKAEPAADPPVAAPPVASSELQRLRDELQRVNQEISRLARVTRPGSDPARHSQLPEKQQLLVQRLDLERKIRAISKP
jgi:hypothetical protein